MIKVLNLNSPRFPAPVNAIGILTSLVTSVVYELQTNCKVASENPHRKQALFWHVVRLPVDEVVPPPGSSPHSSPGLFRLSSSWWRCCCRSFGSSSNPRSHFLHHLQLPPLNHRNYCRAPRNSSLRSLCGCCLS